MKIWLMVAIVCFSGTAQADLYKCSDSGKIVYQDKPFANDTKQLNVIVTPGETSKVEAEDSRARLDESYKKQKALILGDFAAKPKPAKEEMEKTGGDWAKEAKALAKRAKESKAAEQKQQQEYLARTQTDGAT